MPSQRFFRVIYPYPPPLTPGPPPRYLLSLVGANAGKDRYYAREVSNIVDSMDSHYHESFRYALWLLRWALQPSLQSTSLPLLLSMSATAPLLQISQRVSLINCGEGVVCFVQLLTCSLASPH